MHDTTAEHVLVFWSDQCVSAKVRRVYSNSFYPSIKRAGGNLCRTHAYICARRGVCKIRKRTRLLQTKEKQRHIIMSLCINYSIRCIID